MDLSDALPIVTQAGWIYLGLGVLVALAYLWVGGSRVDDSIRGSSPAFRLWILPSATVLWPVVVIRWIRGFSGDESPTEEPGAERSEHKG